MGFDYFTTIQLASELNRVLFGGVISGASFRDKDLKLKIDQRGLICFQCKPNGLVLYNPNDAKSLTSPSKEDPVRYFIGARLGAFTPLFSLCQIDRNKLRHAAFHHSDAVQAVYPRHSRSVVCYDEKTGAALFG